LHSELALLRTLPSVASRRSVGVAAGALLLAGAGLGGLPLLEVPGYELGELGALVAVAILGPWLGLAAARLERGRPDPSPAAAWVAAAGVATALLAALLAGSTLRAAFGPCRPLYSAAFFPALALPSAWLAAALAVACGFTTRGPLRAGALYAGVALLFLAVRLWWAYRGPEAYLTDPLWGYFPGPLYDEALPLDGRLWLARGEAVGWAVAVAGAAELLASPGLRASPAAPAGLRRALALLAAGLCLGGSAWGARVAQQGGPDLRAAIARALGGRRDGPRCTVFFAAEKPAAASRELLDECEFHVADVAATLGIAHPPRVKVFVYRSEEEKRRWVGASRTDYTKPWLAEIEIDDQPLPHPVLRHEIVHAVASVLAPGPLRLSARWRVLPALALVEGLAVALETPRGGYTVNQWSRAARDLGYLPDLERILGPAGFWSQAPARAYTAAGSFLAFLLRRYGPGPVTAAYADGDLARAFGRPLGALLAEWRASLDAVPADAELLGAAQRWFGRGSLFERRCAREAASLQRRAGSAAAAGRTEEACRLWARQGELGIASDALLAEAQVLAAAGQLDRAGRQLEAAAARLPPGSPGRRAQLAAAEGDLAWRHGAVATALERWREASRGPLDRPEARLLEVKAAAARDPALSAAARSLLLSSEPLALARLARVDRPLSAYLLGRALLQGGDRAAAGAELARALEGGLPPLTALEARLSLAEARCDPADAPRLAPLADASPGDRARLDEARRRCEVEAGLRPSSAADRSPPAGSSPRSGAATTSP
jgi:hypothetical protein